MTIDQNPSGLSRRTVAKGITWAAPVLAVGVAAPAMAASGGAPTLVYQGACKFPGNSCSKAQKGYAFKFTVTNSSGKDIKVCTPLMSNVVGTSIVFNYTGDSCINIPAGQSGNLYFFFSGSGDSGNQTFTFTLTIPWGHNCPCSSETYNHPPIVQNISVGGTPPHGDCVCGASFIPIN